MLSSDCTFFLSELSIRLINGVYCADGPLHCRSNMSCEDVLIGSIFVSVPTKYLLSHADSLISHHIGQVIPNVITY